MSAKRFAPALASALAFSVASPQAIGEMSLRCIYDVMTSVPLNIHLCGEALDRATAKEHSQIGDHSSLAVHSRIGRLSSDIHRAAGDPAATRLASGEALIGF
jgi:hypothetical protein